MAERDSRQLPEVAGALGDPEPRPGANDAELIDAEFEVAIQTGKATFRQWVDTHYFSKPEFNDVGEVSVRRYARYKQPIFGAFVKCEGRVVDSYTCQRVVAAIALTEKRKRRWSLSPSRTIHIVNNAPREAERDADAVAALGLTSDIDALSSRADEFLVGRLGRVFVDQLYGCGTDAMAILDEAARRLTEPASSRVGLLTQESALVAQAHSRLKVTEDYLHWAAARIGSLRYLLGAVLGATIIPLAMWTVATLARPQSEWTGLLWAVSAGAVGAVASVLDRANKNRLKIDAEAGHARLMLLGAIRPILGAIVAALAFFAAGAGILPVASTPEFRRLSLLVVIGFAAGFSERFAEDMLGYVGSTVQPNAPGSHDQA